MGLVWWNRLGTVAELDAHSKTLGTDKIVFSDFGEMIRAAIGWLEE